MPNTGLFRREKRNMQVLKELTLKEKNVFSVIML